MLKARTKCRHIDALERGFEHIENQPISPIPNRVDILRAGECSSLSNGQANYHLPTIPQKFGDHVVENRRIDAHEAVRCWVVVIWVI